MNTRCFQLEKKKNDTIISTLDVLQVLENDLTIAIYNYVYIIMYIHVFAFQ